jgi:hypothetical protein
MTAEYRRLAARPRGLRMESTAARDCGSATIAPRDVDSRLA